MTRRRVLVVGGGGREHALCWKLRQSPRCEALFCAPGNAGIAQIAEPVPIGAREIERLADWARAQRIDLAVIGPDDPLADGIVDALHSRGVRAFGPTRAAAEVESSKAWGKQLCREWDIPTGDFAVFDDRAAAHAYVEARAGNVVIKADGLAAGKGVSVCPTAEEAHAAIDRVMAERAFGAAGDRVVVEELLTGREVSVTAVCDGQTYRMLPFSCDHKAVFDGNRGPNTGGMGTYSPPDFVTPELAREIELRVIAPAVRGMARAGRPFVGFLYPGVFVTPGHGRGPEIRVFEFNARLGDPEAQVLLPRLDLDLLDVLDRAVDGRLSELPVALPQAAPASCCVIVASAGYPGSHETGRPIAGLDRLDPEVLLFHAGTRRTERGFETAGGRVIGVTALGESVAAARARAYANVDRLHFEGMHYRRDIAAA
ncbi:MAG TPA: phosphoribosylamine--glycine ligase [Chloroflexota bacterium]